MDNTIDNKKQINLIQLKFDQIKDLLQESLYYQGRFFGEPVLIKDLGENTDELRNFVNLNSMYNHPLLTTIYGIIIKENDDKREHIYIVKELVDGKNFYDIINLSYDHDKLVIIYQIIICIEYLHSFNIFYKFLKPSKIFVYNDIKIKILNLIQSDMIQNRKDIISSPLSDHQRFLCPDIYNPAVLDIDKPYIDIYSIGCLLFYIIFNKLPWDDLVSKEEILCKYKFGENFIDKYTCDRKITEIAFKCIRREYETITELKREIENLPEIILFTQENFTEYEYREKNNNILENINNIVEQLEEKLKDDLYSVRHKSTAKKKFR